MEISAKAAWLMMLAGALILASGGCTRTSKEEFATYEQLERSSRSQAEKGAASSTPKVVADAKTSPTSVSNPGSGVPNADVGNEKRKASAVTQVAASTPQRDPAAGVDKSSASLATNESRIPAKTNLPPAGQPATNPSQSPLPAKIGGSQLALAKGAAGGASARKPQLLVPSRSFKTEGADGALRVSYDDLDLLKVLNLEPVTPDAPAMMPGWLKKLDGQRIRIRGFMYPTFQQTGIHAFALARDNQICCFGRNPKIYDVFDVALRHGVTTDYIPNRPFDVVGVFHIKPDSEEGKLYRLYEMDDAVVIGK
jgi:hypothetical protein